MGYGNYPDLSKVEKILVIKMRHIGDVLLASAVFSVLKSHFPSSGIDALIYKESAPMLEGHEGIRRILRYDRAWKKKGFFVKNFLELRLLRQIRKERYDLVVNLTEGDRGAIVALVSKARIKVGFEPKGRWQKKVYTHLAKTCPTPRHAVEQNLDVLRRIGIFPKVEEREIQLHVPEEAAVSAQMRVPYETFILIHPTSRWRFKCWPKDKMRTLTEELLQRGKRVVFTSGPDPEEKAMVADIIRGLDVCNLSGLVSLQELGALIVMSECLICVDSVPFHMANALKQKVIALFGPTSDVTWGPWRNPHATVVAQNMSCRPCYRDGCGGSKVSDCLETLPVDRVLQVVLKKSLLLQTVLV